MKPVGVVLLSAALFGWAGGALPADIEAESDKLTLNGFGTLGLARSDNESVHFVRDLSQPDGIDREWSARIDSVLGVQAGYRFGTNLDGVLQVITRYRYDGGHHPEVSWAFLRYNPGPSTSLRFGRLGTEFYMAADSRLVGYANLTVRPAPDFFHSLIFTYIDGADVSLARPVGDGLLLGKLYAGVSPENSPFIDDLHWDMRGSPIVGSHLDYLTGPWQVRLGHARVRFDKDPPFDALVQGLYGLPGFIANVPEMSAIDTWSGFTSLGVLYDRGALQIQAMLSRIDHETVSYEDARAAYVVAGYRFGRITPYLGYSKVKTTPETLTSDPASPYTAIATGLIQQTHGDQHTLTAGVRWDIRPGFALKAQVDHIDGDSSSLFPFREGDNPAAWDGHMNVYSLALDMTF